MAKLVSEWETQLPLSDAQKRSVLQLQQSLTSATPSQLHTKSKWQALSQPIGLTSPLSPGLGPSSGFTGVPPGAAGTLAGATGTLTSIKGSPEVHGKIPQVLDSSQQFLNWYAAMEEAMELDQEERYR